MTLVRKSDILIVKWLVWELLGLRALGDLFSKEGDVSFLNNILGKVLEAISWQLGCKFVVLSRFATLLKILFSDRIFSCLKLQWLSIKSCFRLCCSFRKMPINYSDDFSVLSLSILR